MSSQQLDEEAVFHIARKLDDLAYREKYLNQICAGDVQLRERVEALLDVHEKEAEFLKSSPEAVPTVDHAPITETAGQQIGPYRLLQQLGEGGFGVVYMAEQKTPVKRRVAIKIIKPGMDTRQVIARFEAERQALAMMDHPNIARALDVGMTDAGRPYFVMELVKGMPITQYCDEHHLSPRERLEMFVPVCLAVQHAHQKGIIHRDIKPSNILVAEYDNQAVPKIIDFGVAKALNQQLTEKTMFTQCGQVIGTLEYMSPEQAKVNQLDVDTRSDIYSLGVVLYELLTGTTPFNEQRLRSAAMDELLRIIREEEPPHPSVQLSSMGTLPSVAANRKTEPRKLGLAMRGELDWIVMRALDKERARRYESASDLARDVQSYLTDKLVAARPPSLAYRLRKYARRHKGFLAGIGGLTVLLVLTALVVARGYQTSVNYKMKSAESMAANAYIDEDFETAVKHYASLLGLQELHLGHEDRRTIRTRDKLAQSYIELDRLSEACTLYEDTLRLRENSKVVAPKETRDTAAKLFKVALAHATELTRNANYTSDALDTAERLAARAVEVAETYELGSGVAARLILVEVAYRRDDMTSCHSHAKELLASALRQDTYPIGLWLALINARLHRSELAQDWFTAAHNIYHPPSQTFEYELLREKAATEIFGSADAPSSDLNIEEEEKLLSRLLEAYKIAPEFQLNRGYRRIRLGRWEEAAKDFETAADETEHINGFKAASRGWMRLHFGKQEMLEEACRDLATRLKNKEFSNQYEVSVAWNLCMIVGIQGLESPWLGIDDTKSPYYRGLEAFYAGNWQEACKHFENHARPTADALGLLLKARAHQKLEEETQAKEALEAAREILNRESPMPDKPMISDYAGYSNSMRWCEPLAVLPIAEMEIAGAYSDIGQLLMDLRKE